jgi:cyanate lyase
LKSSVKSITTLLPTPRLLPNESEVEFQSSLQCLLSEFEIPSPLNVALVIQLNECIWWIKRHTVDKELLLHESMAGILTRSAEFPQSYDNRRVSMALEGFLAGNASEEDEQWIDELLNRAELTVSDLRARGFKGAYKHIKMADDLIHRQYQTMRHLQKSIDSVDFKSRLIKRMDLELAVLENNALAIDANPS